MSRRAAMDFLRKAVEDPGLRGQLRELAKRNGFEFDPEELSPEELEEASGGLAYLDPGTVDGEVMPSPHTLDGGIRPLESASDPTRPDGGTTSEDR